MFLLLLLPVLARPVFGQAPGVKLELDTTTLELGEAVNLKLVCTNIGVPKAPQAFAPDGLELHLLNPTPMSSSFTQIINGRRSSRSTYTYQLRLTAMKEGSYTLGPITVEAGGAVYQTRPVTISVRDTQSVSSPSGDRFIFAELRVEPTSLFVTEHYNATLTFGIRKVEIGGRIYNVNMLQNVLDGRGSQLSIFAEGRARRSERWLRDSDGTRHQYEVFAVPVRIRAEEPGEIQVGPVFLKARYPTRMRRGLFGGYEVTQHRREVARTDAITIRVKSPPEEGRPTDYTGAIGRFAFKVSALPDRVEQGQPITLVLSISGSPLEGVSGPNLTVHPELASRFDYTHDELVGDLEGAAKVFRRAVFPKQVGEQTVPPITWSYFDPSRATYVSLSSEPIPITVDPATETTTSMTALQPKELEAEHTGLTVLSGGLSPNFIDASAVLANQSFQITGTWTAVLIASPLAWFVVMLTNRHRTRILADPHGARRRRARKRAFSRIGTALRHRDRAAILHALAEAMTGYFADRFGLGVGTVTAADVRLILATNGFDDSVTGEVVEFLETCDASHYTPSEIEERSPREAAASVRRWIAHIEKHKP